MGVYLRAKLEVSSIILTGFRLGELLPLPPPQNQPLKSPPRLGLKLTYYSLLPNFSKYFFKTGIFSLLLYLHVFAGLQFDSNYFDILL